MQRQTSPRIQISAAYRWKLILAPSFDPTKASGRGRRFNLTELLIHERRSVAIEDLHNSDSQLVPPLPLSDRVRERRTDGLCIAVLCLLVLFSWLPRYRGPIDLRWDGGVYYVLGTSLADGKGYRLLNEPGEIEAIQYPPGLPVIVAIHQMILGNNDPAIVGVWMRRSWLLVSLLYICLFSCSVESFCRAATRCCSL